MQSHITSRFFEDAFSQDLQAFRDQFPKGFADAKYLAVDQTVKRRARQRAEIALNRDAFVALLQDDATGQVAGLLLGIVREVSDYLHRTEWQAVQLALQSESAARATFVRELFFGANVP